MKIAERMFRAIQEEKSAECDLCEAIQAIVGECDGTNYDDFKFDDYDASFELKGCLPGWKPTDDQIKSCIDLGFLHCWLCYTDGSEWYYSNASGWHWRERSGG